jgi:dethiobiotin synthetase
MKDTYFVTGISTDVGKTVVAAVITEALKADYWKPIQAGGLDESDAIHLAQWISNSNSKIHKSSIELTSPMSPHAAAEIDGLKIKSKDLKRPATKNSLVIEGAGGLLVPINQKETIANLIWPKDKIILVSRHYLGSINHTLLSVEYLKALNLNIFGMIFIGDELKSTEDIIAKMTGVRVLGRINEEPYIDQNVILEYADIFKDILKK